MVVIAPKPPAMRKEKVFCRKDLTMCGDAFPLVAVSNEHVTHEGYATLNRHTIAAADRLVAEEQRDRGRFLLQEAHSWRDCLRSKDNAVQGHYTMHTATPPESITTSLPRTEAACRGSIEDSEEEDRVLLFLETVQCIEESHSGRDLPYELYAERKNLAAVQQLLENEECCRVEVSIEASAGFCKLIFGSDYSVGVAMKCADSFGRERTHLASVETTSRDAILEVEELSLEYILNVAAGTLQIAVSSLCGLTLTHPLFAEHIVQRSLLEEDETIAISIVASSIRTERDQWVLSAISEEATARRHISSEEATSLEPHTLAKASLAVFSGDNNNGRKTSRRRETLTAGVVQEVMDITSLEECYRQVRVEVEQKRRGNMVYEATESLQRCSTMHMERRRKRHPPAVALLLCEVMQAAQDIVQAELLGFGAIHIAKLLSLEGLGMRHVHAVAYLQVPRLTFEPYASEVTIQLENIASFENTMRNEIDDLVAEFASIAKQEAEDVGVACGLMNDWEVLVNMATNTKMHLQARCEHLLLHEVGRIFDDTVGSMLPRYLAMQDAAARATEIENLPPHLTVLYQEACAAVDVSVRAAAEEHFAVFVDGAALLKRAYTETTRALQGDVATWLAQARRISSPEAELLEAHIMHTAAATVATFETTLHSVYNTAERSLHTTVQTISDHISSSGVLCREVLEGKLLAQHQLEVAAVCCVGEELRTRLNDARAPARKAHATANIIAGEHRGISLEVETSIWNDPFLADAASWLQEGIVIVQRDYAGQPLQLQRHLQMLQNTKDNGIHCVQHHALRVLADVDHLLHNKLEDVREESAKMHSNVAFTYLDDPQRCAEIIRIGEYNNALQKGSDSGALELARLRTAKACMQERERITIEEGAARREGIAALKRPGVHTPLRETVKALAMQCSDTEGGAEETEAQIISGLMSCGVLTLSALLAVDGKASRHDVTKHIHTRLHAPLLQCVAERRETALFSGLSVLWVTCHPLHEYSGPYVRCGARTFRRPCSQSVITQYDGVWRLLPHAGPVEAEGTQIDPPDDLHIAGETFVFACMTCNLRPAYIIRSKNKGGGVVYSDGHWVCWVTQNGDTKHYVGNDCSSFIESPQPMTWTPPNLVAPIACQGNYVASLDLSDPLYRPSVNGGILPCGAFLNNGVCARYDPLAESGNLLGDWVDERGGGGRGREEGECALQIHARLWDCSETESPMFSVSARSGVLALRDSATDSPWCESPMERYLLK